MVREECGGEGEKFRAKAGVGRWYTGTGIRRQDFLQVPWWWCVWWGIHGKGKGNNKVQA